MQVNAVTTKATNFGNFAHPGMDEIERLAAADDKQLRQISRYAASQQINDKKYRRVSNALWYGLLPVAGGLSAAVDPRVVGRIPKLKAFGKQAAIWAGTLAVIDGTFAIARAINKDSKSAGRFNEKHPVLATILTLGASIAALIGAGKGAQWVLGKYGDKLAKFFKTEKIATYVKESKTITKVMEKVRKAPSAIKELAKAAINWGPFILVATSIGHTFSHEKARAIAETNTYNILKENQAAARAILDKGAVLNA